MKGLTPKTSRSAICRTDAACPRYDFATVVKGKVTTKSQSACVASRETLG